VNITKRASRRSFLHLGAGAAAALGMSDILAQRGLAASSTGRAVVCVYLTGGHDSNNMIVPLESAAYDDYAKGRGPLALPRESLLAVDSGGSGKFGFHPSLTGLRDLYNQNALAILANVGPVTMNSSYAPPHVRYVPDGYMGVDWSVPTVAPLARGVSMAGTVVSGERGKILAMTLRAAGPVGSFPDTVFGRGLEQIAKVLRLGVASQTVFTIPVGGYFSHRREPDLYSTLDHGLTAFYRFLHDQGLADRVTIYTDTEFNRTLVPNASGNSDPAWGGHQMILGGSVLGGRIYGKFPSLQVGGQDDAAGNGTWRPTTLDLQYAATLAGWQGTVDLETLPGYEGLKSVAQKRLDFLTA
jgi:uncharacterized protein (DUF1501 family)